MCLRSSWSSIRRSSSSRFRSLQTWNARAKMTKQRKTTSKKRSSKVNWSTGTAQSTSADSRSLTATRREMAWACLAMSKARTGYFTSTKGRGAKTAWETAPASCWFTSLLSSKSKPAKKTSTSRRRSRRRSYYTTKGLSRTDNSTRTAL